MPKPPPCPVHHFQGQLRSRNPQILGLLLFKNTCNCKVVHKSKYHSIYRVASTGNVFSLFPPSLAFPEEKNLNEGISLSRHIKKGRDRPVRLIRLAMSVIRIFIGFSLIGLSFASTPDPEFNKCGFTDGNPTYYDPFVYDYQLCPKSVMLCSEVGLTARKNCVVCCLDKNNSPGKYLIRGNTVWVDHGLICYCFSEM